MVTSSTRGCSGQRASSAWRIRALVDLPTATLPATPMTNGVPRCAPWPLPASAEEGVEGAAQAGGGLDVEVEEPGERQVDVPHLVEVDDVPEPAQLLDLGGGQRQRGLVAQGTPFGARQVDVRRRSVLGASLGAPWRRSDHRFIVAGVSTEWGVGSVTWGRFRAGPVPRGRPHRGRRAEDDRDGRRRTRRAGDGRRRGTPRRHPGPDLCRSHQPFTSPPKPGRSPGVAAAGHRWAPGVRRLSRTPTSSPIPQWWPRRGGRWRRASPDLP